MVKKTLKYVATRPVEPSKIAMLRIELEKLFNEIYDTEHLSPRDEKHLIQSCHDDAVAFELLVRHCLKYILVSVNEFMRTGMTLELILEESEQALREAIQDFQPASKSKLKDFVLGRIRETLKKKIPPEESSIKSKSYIEFAVATKIHSKVLEVKLNQVIEVLAKKEPALNQRKTEKILRVYYGIHDDSFVQKKPRDIASIFNITPQAVVATINRVWKNSLNADTWSRRQFLEACIRIRSLEQYLKRFKSNKAIAQVDAIAVFLVSSANGTVKTCEICFKQKKRICRDKNSGKLICKSCYGRNQRRACSQCGRMKNILACTKGGKPLCPNCYKEICSHCRRLGRVASRDSQGKPFCRNCYKKYIHKDICSKCNIFRFVYSRDQNRYPICQHCTAKMYPLVCGNCLKLKPARYRLPNGDPLCSFCYQQLRNLPKCS